MGSVQPKQLSHASKSVEEGEPMLDVQHFKSSNELPENDRFHMSALYDVFRARCRSGFASVPGPFWVLFVPLSLGVILSLPVMLA